MSLRRLLQILLTGFVGQGLSVLSQLLVPRFFFKFYGSGVEVYGEWTALSAAISYLGTLNYGVQTYASNQMTILYGGGDVQGAKAIQASAFRLLLLFCAVFAVGGVAVFLLPVAGWLRLRHVGAHAAAVTLYLLILQIGMNMFFSLLTNSYMAVGLLHRGNYISKRAAIVDDSGDGSGHRTAQQLSCAGRGAVAVVRGFSCVCAAGPAACGTGPGAKPARGIVGAGEGDSETERTLWADCGGGFSDVAGTRAADTEGAGDQERWRCLRWSGWCSRCPVSC